jgi:hypothetical protein
LANGIAGPGFSRGCVVISASPSRAVSMVEGCVAIDSQEPRKFLARSEPKHRPAPTSAAAGVFTEQWQADIRSCMRAMDSTLIHLMRSITEGQLLTARSEARCLSKQAHTLDALLVPCPDVNL